MQSHESYGVAHLAGPDITVDGRWLRQRCVWCGAILIDYDLTRVAVPVEPGEEPEPPATWKAGAWVVHDGPMWSTLELEGAEDADGELVAKLPANSCMRMPPEETR